jgi:heme A synthase
VTTVHLVLGVAVVVLNLGVGAWGGWRWYRIEPSPAFWPWMRLAQAALVIQVALGGVLVLLGHRPADDLHYLYGILPLVVSFVAEGLRAGSAETVLEARNLPDAQAVGRLAEAEQRFVVLAIVRREMGVMALAAIAVAGLAFRAGTTSGAFL